MTGFKPKNKRAASAEGAHAPQLGFPGKGPQSAGQAQALNQAPDSIPGMFKPGEFVLPPDTVHAMGGKEALQGVVDATHTPAPDAAVVPQGFRPEVFFAQGGAPEDENAKRFVKVPEQFGNRGNSFGDAAAIARDSSVAPPSAGALSMGTAPKAQQPVTTPEARKAVGVFPYSSPDAGANVYGAAGVSADQLGSSGKFAKVPDAIGQQPGRSPATAAPVPAAIAPQRTEAERQALIGQIPGTDRPAPTAAATTAPSAPASAPVAQGFSPRTPGASELYMQDRAQEMRDQAGAGNYAGAVGTGVRTAVQGLGMYGIEAVDKATAPWLDAGRRMAGGVFGMDAKQQNAAATKPDDMQSKANTVAAPDPSNPHAKANAAKISALDAQNKAADAQSKAAGDTGGITRIDRPGHSPLFTDNKDPQMAGFLGRPAGGPTKEVSSIMQRMSDQSQNEAFGRFQKEANAAQYAKEVQQAQAINASAGEHSRAVQNRMDQEKYLRTLDVRASSIAGNPAQRMAAQKAYSDALAQDAGFRAGADAGSVARTQNEGSSAREQMQQQGATARAQMQEAGQNSRFGQTQGLAQQKFGMEREAQGFQTRAATQSEQLRNTLLDPKATPEQRSIAQRNLAALSGKTAADRMQTVALPDTTTDTGQVVRGGQALVRTLEDGTVEQVPIGGQQQASASPYKDGQELRGKDGKTYVVKNGLPVLK